MDHCPVHSVQVVGAFDQYPVATKIHFVFGVTSICQLEYTRYYRESLLVASYGGANLLKINGASLLQTLELHHRYSAYSHLLLPLQRAS